MELVCPMCKVPLKREKEILRCKSCGLECIHDGMTYDFLGRGRYYWGEIPIEEMEEVLDMSRVRGWRVAVRDIAHKYPNIGEYIMNNGRIDWLFHCLDLSSTNSCLDLGSGWGTITFALAKFYREVWSLEAVEQRIEFQKIRQKQSKIENVSFVRADWANLPFPDDYFDLVAANGVLEWVGLSDFFRNPKQIQLDFLREIKRVLKPKGCLYIGIENRFGLPFLLGSKDHSGLPFTSVLPRRLADLVVKLFRRTKGTYKHDNRMAEEWPDYRTYTYSFWGYRRLLEETGFSPIDLYWTLNYNNPKRAGRFDGESLSFLLRWLKESVVLSKRFRSLLVSISSYIPGCFVKPVFYLVCPSFLIFAYKEGKGDLLEPRLIQSDSCSSFVRIGGSCGANSKVTYFLLTNGEPYLILKFPRFKENASAIATEEMKMGQFNHLDIRREVVGSTPLFIEKPILGRAPRPHDLSDSLRVLDWLLDFQRRTHTGFWGVEQLEVKFAELSDFLPEVPVNNKVRLRVKQSIDSLLQFLREARLPKCSEHGDFYSGNILIRDDGRIYVTDWEFYREVGDPLFDFVFFAIYSSTKGAISSLFVNDICGKGRYSAIFKILLSRFSQANGLASNLILSAVPYVILRCIHRSMEGKDNKHIAASRYTYLLEFWCEAHGCRCSSSPDGN